MSVIRPFFNPVPKEPRRPPRLPKKYKEPDDEAAELFRPVKQGKFKRILGFVRPYRAFIALSLVFALLQAAAQLLAPVFMGRAIDFIVGKNNVNMPRVAFYALCMGAAVAAAFVFGWLMNLCASSAAQSTVRDIRLEVFKKLNAAPVGEIDKFSHGNLLSRITNDAERISDGLIHGVAQLFAGVALVAGTIIFMLSINAAVAAAVIVLTPLSFVAAFFIAKSAQKMFARQAKAEGELSGLSEEYIANQRLVKLLGYESRVEEKFDEHTREIEKYGRKATFISAIINPGTRLVNGFVYITVLLTGAFLLIKSPSWAQGIKGASWTGAGGGLTVGGIAMFLSYALQYAKPFNEISAVYGEMQTALVSAGRIFEVLDIADEPDESRLPALTVGEGRVEFRDVSFSYTGEPFIEGFNLTASPGMRVAIVGRTGCGKTTLLSLIMRFYETDGGSIEVDGVSIHAAGRESVRKNVGMVLQDTWLKDGPVRDNIAYGRPDATLDEIKAAAQKARIDGFINRLKDGYDTVIAREKLSAGQMQLISIARVFLALPPILILDEATSNIDALTELKIQEAFKEMMQGHTCFIVAHRMSTVKSADLILVMESGAVIESGTHEQLLSLNGAYARLLHDSLEIPPE